MICHFGRLFQSGFGSRTQSCITPGFARLEPHDLGGGNVQLVAPSRFVADYIRTHYISRLTAAALAEDRGFVAFEISETLKPR